MRLEGLASRGRKALELLNDGVWRNNALIFHAVGLFPLVASGVTLKNAVLLSAVTAISLIFTSVVISLIGNKLNKYLRSALCAVLSAVFLIPAMILADKFSNETFTALQFTLILLSVNNLLYFRKGIVAINKGVMTALVSSIAHSIGFALVLCVVSCIREILAFGTVWGVALPFERRVPAAALPFAGFIALAFIIAIFKGVLGFLQREGEVEAE